MKKTMIALKNFYYDKKDVVEGKEVQIEEKDVEILTLAKAIKQKDEEKPKRTYKRRDMVAEDTES